MEIALSPALQRYVDDQVKSGRYLDAGEVTRAALRRMEAQGNARGLHFGAAGDEDIMAVAFLVLMDSAKSAQEDLKAIMAGVKAINAAKRALRALLARINRDVAANAGRGNEDRALDLSKGLGSMRAYHRVPLPQPDAEAPGGVRFVPTDLHPGRLAHAADLDAIADELKGKLDSMSEMGEMESLRLQMAMDRQSKMMSTLSNVLKKISDTGQSIIQNMK